MPRRPKSGSSKWTTKLDEQQVREALDDALVDAYSDYEQHSGLLTMIEEQLRFPFQAKVLGQVVTVVGMEWPEDDEFGLDLVCERNGQRHRVEARSVDLVPPLPAGHLYLAAYLEWKRYL